MYAEYVAALFGRSSGCVPENKSAVGSTEDTVRSVSVLYADLAQREEDALRSGKMRLLLLPAYPSQEPQPTDASPAVFPIRTERRSPPAGSDTRRAIGRGESRGRTRDFAGPARKSRVDDVPNLPGWIPALIVFIHHKMAAEEQ